MARGKAPTFQVQRATILDAAAGLFAARGFHHASMAEIARECGVSKALLIGLAVCWVGMGTYVLSEKLKKRRKKD